MANFDDPHDHLFKLTFARKELASIFSEKFLPYNLVKNMDRTTLRRVPGEYLTPELREFFSDMVYECQYGNDKVLISLLFEHKSYVTGKQNLILTFFVYLYKTGKRSGEFYRKLVKRLPESIKIKGMTAYDSIILKGERKGKLEGKLEEQNLVITNAFKENLSIDLIAKLTNLSTQEVIKRMEKLGLKSS